MMAEYIDRETLRKILKGWRDAHADVDDEQGCGLLEDVIWEVDAQSAADVVPVVHGRWEMRQTGRRTDTGVEYKAYCTACNEPNKQYQPPFCPHCGAKMAGKGDDQGLLRHL